MYGMEENQITSFLSLIHNNSNGSGSRSVSRFENYWLSYWRLLSGIGSGALTVHRQCAKVYTDFWEAYDTIIPSKRHEAVGKDRGLTSYIERLNNTLRQRVSRLVRKTLSFSKKLENHIGAIWLFIHDYNRQIRRNLAEQGNLVFSFVLQ